LRGTDTWNRYPAAADLPVFAVCGWSGSGKTTLLEPVVRHLCAKGLKVALVKNDVHGINIDRPGKDSDRLFRSGADVLLQGPQQGILRVHGDRRDKLAIMLGQLCREYDLVLVEGHKGTPLPKVWLLGPDEDDPPADVSGIVATLPRDSDRVSAAISILEEWLPKQWLKTPVYGCILIGGKSRRMGVPKHLLHKNGKTWLERTAEKLEQVTQRVVIAGAGALPEALGDQERLPDVPEANGPMAGILAAMRWAPRASWLVAACDLPNLNVDALQWLLSTRAPGVWATLPRLPGSPGVEALLAHYDFRCYGLLERLVVKRDYCPARIVQDPRVVTPCTPPLLRPAWTNVNTEAELELPLARSDISGAY
jgi:molybdopterin-guanine dinucleotide biosynthesis protein MobB